MRIGEVARRSGVSARMLRHYETLGLVRPTGRTGVGYREYSRDDIRRILHIEILRSLGLSLRDVGRALDDPGFTPAAHVDELIEQTRERIAREEELLARLRRIDATDPTDWDDVLQVVALLHNLGSESAGKRQRAALSSVSATGPVPVEALVEAVLREPDPSAAGALRWALARSGDAALAPLADALTAPEPAVRKRAVDTIAKIPHGTATALLRDALTSPDVVVVRSAALALAPRGVPDAIPTLLAMIVEGTNDADAADALSALATAPPPTPTNAPASGDVPASMGDRGPVANGGLAGERGLADQIAGRLVERLGGDGVEPAARQRLTQALGDIPGAAAARALAELTHDQDRIVALTATSILKLRDSR
ncbi:MerR family transcriptional regulator [Micromonospora sp. WMMD882]|uniref:HEAT repeat domain-containing protein n=1 Tax=Micromonospora sp. WMMD882 TaxID=3015151 RepID=UPI00248C682A|nr:HEAT repeat domain-containing protein [Micromonospora sp. WMMD882]WBB80429.1 MerR family transcriptional regulator [Micromonospora sp. WMMD882]